MGCGCGGAQVETTPQAEYVVTLPDGTTKTVIGEHNAKIEITMAGGGSYTKR